MAMSDADLKKMNENYSPTRVWRILDPKSGGYIYATTTAHASPRMKRWYFFAADHSENLYEGGIADLKIYVEDFGTSWEEVPLSYCSGKIIESLEEMSDLPFGTFVSSTVSDESCLMKIQPSGSNLWLRTGRVGLFFSKDVFDTGFRVVSDQLLID